MINLTKVWFTENTDIRLGQNEKLKPDNPCSYQTISTLKTITDTLIDQT